jgi:hypothetical protein
VERWSGEDGLATLFLNSSIAGFPFLGSAYQIWLRHRPHSHETDVQDNAATKRDHVNTASTLDDVEIRTPAWMRCEGVLARRARPTWALAGLLLVYLPFRLPPAVLTSNSTSRFVNDRNRHREIKSSPYTPMPFVPLERDVREVRAVTASLGFPAELVLLILDYARYWAEVTHESVVHDVLLDEEWSADFSAASIYLWAELPEPDPRFEDEKPKIREIDFTIVSHDQGWTTEDTKGFF